MTSDVSTDNIAPEHFDHVPLSALADPLPILRAFREQCPVAHSDAHDGFWTLFRYADISDAARDPERFSSRDVTIPTVVVPSPPVPITADPPIHMDYRGPLLNRFSAGAVAHLEPTIRAAAIQLIEAFVERGSADLAQELCVPYPAHGAMQVLSLPTEDVPRFTDWASRIFMNQGDMSIPLELAQYFGPLYDEYAGSSADDIPSLARRLLIGGREIELLEWVMLMLTLIVASLDTTANASANILLLLADRTDLRARLIEDPGLLPSAVEELLRYISPLPALSRVANADVEIGGCPIKAGERVLLDWQSGNHDPAEFPDPDEIILDRSPNRHLSFGIGPHRCLGMHLARLEVRILLEEVLARIPDYRVVHTGVVRGSGVTRMVFHLPVEFSPGAPRGIGSVAGDAVRK